MRTLCIPFILFGSLLFAGGIVYAVLGSGADAEPNTFLIYGTVGLGLLIEMIGIALLIRSRRG